MSFEINPDHESKAPQRVRDCSLPLSEEACALLVRAHGPMVKSVCQRIVGDAALAEDAAQEVFLLLVRKLPTLSPQTILGGWLYVTACHLARTHLRTHLRRQRRENQTELTEGFMRFPQDTVWNEMEPLLDDAMLTLSQRQRELVLFRYFQNMSQRAAAGIVGCSESVASRELASAIERLRRFFDKRGVTVTGPALVALLAARGAEASIGGAAMAATMASASALAGGTAVGAPLFFAIMNTTTTTKIVVGAVALAIALTAIRHYSGPENLGATKGGAQNAMEGASPEAGVSNALNSTPRGNQLPGGISPSAAGIARVEEKAKGAAAAVYDEETLKAAREKQEKFFRRLIQLALMNDPSKVQEILVNEYGIQLSVEEVSTLQKGGEKGFAAGVIELWASRQPQQALAWAASTASNPRQQGMNMIQSFVDAARSASPNLNRESLASILPEGPGTAEILDLLEATSDPVSLGNRILTMSDPTERASHLRMLAQGWGNAQSAAQWAQQNLSGSDREAFYSQVGYNLAHENPQLALQVLSELRGTESYTQTFGAMMRGLVQTGGQGQQVAELIANANLPVDQRAALISELSRRWVRADPDATVAWVNGLTAPEDFRAAIPLLVSQLDNDRVRRTMEGYLQNRDPVMESALIEAAAPSSLGFDPERSRLILDPLITQDPNFRLAAAEPNASGRDAQLWNAVNQAARRQAEVGNPATAMDWLGRLRFASDGDYARAIGNVLSVWNNRSDVEAADWLRNASLSPAVRAGALRASQNN